MKSNKGKYKIKNVLKDKMGITLIALVKNVKSSNNKGFLLQTI